MACRLLVGKEEFPDFPVVVVVVVGSGGGGGGVVGEEFVEMVHQIGFFRHARRRPKDTGCSIQVKPKIHSPVDAILFGVVGGRVGFVPCHSGWHEDQPNPSVLRLLHQSAPFG